MTHSINSNNANADEPWSASIKLTGNQHLIRSDSTANNQDDQTVHDSSLSIYERLRHFLYINFVLNKRTFVLSILSYLADLILFTALTLYLFSNKKFIYEYKCKPVNTTTSSATNTTAAIKPNSNNDTLLLIKLNDLLTTSITNTSDLVFNNASKTQLESKQFVEIRSLKQSYLTLQIVTFFVFFICFVFSYLIKLQFKYHRLALNLYDYDVDASVKINSNNQTMLDRDGRESVDSTTTASHFSSSAANNNKKLTSLVKRVLVRLLTKFATILLNTFFGYQFCQNCFIQQWNETYNDAFTIFTHIFIFVCVVYRCLVVFLLKKNSMNKLDHLKKLQQKQKDLFDPTNEKNPHRSYYLYYYSYLIKSSQQQANQLKQHQNNQNTFRVFQIADMSLFVGFVASLFHLFNFLKAFEIFFLFIPIFLTLILFRFKSILNASINLFVIFISLLIISKYNNTNSITNISDLYLSNSKSNQTTKLSDLADACTNLEKNQSNNSSIFNLFSYNLFTFLCFLLTFYFESLLSIYYCSLTSLERWNISFLCKLSFWRKLSIFVTFLVYLMFVLACTVALCVQFKQWSFLVLPFFFLVSFVWCCFELLNTINLTHLMNKISDCYLMLNESNSDNASNLIKRSHNSNTNNSNNNTNNINPLLNDDNSCSNSNNRVSTLSHSSSNNNNNKNYSNFKLTKFLARFLSYNKLNFNGSSSNQLNSINIPIHRILAYKGVRNLGSISYRISLYCFTQTILLAVFTYYTNSPFTIGVYLISVSLNFIWISLLYQFCKSMSGNCIAYALVAPPVILNQQNGTMNTTSTFGTSSTANSSMSSNNPTLFSKKYRTTSSSATTTTTGNSINTATTSSSLFYRPLIYQQEINKRCANILIRMQSFFQFHLIENFGCDLASNGLTKEYLELKLRNFFQKKNSLDGSPFNTYFLYYCGPTSSQTDNISFLDGNELSIEEIINCWKEINCNIKPKRKEENTSDSDSPASDTQQQQVTSDLAKKNKAQHSRLIIMLDSEHIAKSLEYVKSKCVESNVYIALQTAKYNYNSQKNGRKTLESKNKSPPSSPQQQPQQQQSCELYLNFGKFTLDWIKSNYCNSNEFHGDDLDERTHFHENFYLSQSEHDNKIEEQDEEEEEDDDDSDIEMDIRYAKQKNQTSTINRKKSQHNSSSSSNVFYEAKCAFSRYWIDFSFDANQKIIAQDFNQFWRSYYPNFICKPLLKLINCRLFYLRFELFKQLLFYLRRLKNRFVPITEYDTGHGFKLFSS